MKKLLDKNFSPNLTFCDNKYKIDMCTNKQSLAHRGEDIFYVWTQKRWKKN